MDKEKIKKAQSAFYARGDAGCGFAEHVAKDPGKYKWDQQVFEAVDVAEIDRYVHASIANPDIQMISIMTPTPADQLHVADLEIPEMGKTEFTITFRDSFRNTTSILGHGADELSAAKTSFIIPKMEHHGHP